MLYDKSCAKKEISRISEFTFFCISVAGGGLGTILACHTFNHKTAKYLFVKLIPYITIAEFFIFALLFVIVGV